MWLPSLEQVVRYHNELIIRSGGTSGMRDVGLVQSAIMRAYASYGGVELYPCVEDKAAAICCGLVSNHGFIDGNKRIGIATMLLILLMNGLPHEYKHEELVKLGLSIAKGDMAVSEVAAWIKMHRVQNADGVSN